MILYGDDWNDPQGIQYLYYSEDGIHFSPCAEFPNRATGIYVPGEPDRSDITKYWGVTVSTKDTYNRRYMERFNIEKVLY